MKNLDILKKQIIILLIFAASALNLHSQNIWEKASGTNAYSVNTFFQSTNGKLLVGTQGGGVYTSTDSGYLWEELNNGILSFHFDINAFNEKQDTLYVATGSAMGGGVYISGDEGTLWSKSSFITGATDVVAIDSVICASTGSANFVYGRSSDYGKNWDITPLPFNEYRSSYKRNGDKLYALSNSKGIECSSDLGLTWSSIGFSEKYCSDYFIINDSIYIVTEDGVFLSGDNGATWKAFDMSPLNGAAVYNLAYSDNFIYCATDTTVFYAPFGDPSLVKWNKITVEGLPTFNDKEINSIIHADNNLIIGINEYQGFYSTGEIWLLKDKSNDATLSDLTVDGTTITGFSSTTYNYTVSTTLITPVEAIPNHPNASYEINEATTLPGTTEVIVTAEDGITQLIYEVNFTVLLGTDATLADLTVDGATIEGFSPGTQTYTMSLPFGTTTVPTVEATTNDENAAAIVNPATALPGTTEVVVTAEDGITQLIYEVNFTILLGTDATLADLTVDGTTIEGFSPGTQTYTMSLPFGTTTVPTVEATTNDENAAAIVNPATALPGTTEVVVTAEDGVTKLTYKVNFRIGVSAFEQVSDKVNIYPNPSDGVFFIDIYEETEISIMDVSSRVLYQNVVSSKTEVDISNNPTGLYIVKINNGKEVKNIKILIR